FGPPCPPPPPCLHERCHPLHSEGLGEGPVPRRERRQHLLPLPWPAEVRRRIALDRMDRHLPGPGGRCTDRPARRGLASQRVFDGSPRAGAEREIPRRLAAA